MRVGMGISIGSETSGSIEDIVVENNTVGLCAKGVGCNMTGYHPWEPAATPCATDGEGICGWNAGLHVKTTMQRGGTIAGVVYRNNSISANFSCISLITNYQAPSVLPVGYPATSIRNISFIGNTCGANQVGLHCNANDTCTDISVIDNTVQTKGAAVPWDFHWIESYTVRGNSPPGALACMHGAMNATNDCKSSS